MNGDPVTLDPGMIRGTQGAIPEARVGAPVFDLLVYETAEGEVVPQIAESFETDDGAVWTLRIREGVRFHDGTDLDAEAVRFNWDRILDEELGSPNAAIARQIESMAVVDPLTLEIRLATPNAHFHRSVASGGMTLIGSPTALSGGGENVARQPVGAGPFRFEEWVQNDRIVLVRNDDYWNAPQPYLDGITFRILPDEDQAINSIVAGEFAALQTYSGARVEEVEGLGLAVSGGPHGIGGFAMSLVTPPFDDVRVRQAVSYGFDQERHNQVIHGGHSQPMATLFPPGHPLHADVRIHENDPERAQALFDEVAAELGGPVTFEIGCFAGGRIVERMCEDLQSQMLEYDNVQATVDVADAATANQRVVGRNFQIHQFGLPGLMDAEPEMPKFFRSDSFLDVASWSNHEVDELLDQGRRSLDTDERRDIYARFAEIWAEEVPWLATTRQMTMWFLDARTRDVSHFNAGNTLWGPVWVADG